MNNKGANYHKTIIIISGRPGVPLTYSQCRDWCYHYKRVHPDDAVRIYKNKVTNGWEVKVTIWLKLW